MIQPQVLLLKEGTDTSQGIGQLISNINACSSVADILRTTLGPMGLDKLIKKGDTATITNDGATIIRLLDVVHPAAKTLADIAQSQDDEAGDGTTSVVLLAAELLQNAKEFIEEGVAPQAIARGYRLALAEALKALDEISVDIEGGDFTAFGVDMGEDKAAAKKFLLTQCAKTSLTSKLIEGDKAFFADLLVSAFLRCPGADTARDFFEIKTVSGGSVTDSAVVEGLAFKKTFSYAGFEQQPKSLTAPRIALLNVELELKTEHVAAEVRVGPDEYKAVVEAEWRLLYDKLDLIVAAGANIVLSKLPIGDLATQYFAEKNIFCAGRVPERDLTRLSKLSGGAIQTSIRALGSKGVLGTCERFEEKQVGKERMNFFYGGEKYGGKNIATLILRGGADQYIAETSRSLNDALCVVRNLLRSPRVVAGGGATEMELSRRLKELSLATPGADAFFVAAFAKALEAVPRALAANAALDATDILNELRCRHHAPDGRFVGVDVAGEGVADCLRNFVWEPAALKRNVVLAAAEAACLVLSVDDTVRAPRADAGRGVGRGGMGGGGGMMMG